MSDAPAIPRLDTVDPGIGRRAALVEAALIWEAIHRNGVRLAFRPEPEPDVSVVIVARDARHLLALTLYRLCAQQALAGVRFEVILVDNASSPETRSLYPHLDGVTRIENAENTGFGPACNAGAERARGRFLLFLNPDVDLMPGAMAAMVAAFRDHADIGIVGARLVFPGGYLQESGAGFRDDAGLTHPHGRGNLDPLTPEHAATRDVGYVSGAVLMIERALFETLGGFDPLFAPAYYEDTDLCLRCHQAGRRVLVQPRATAIHYENATSAKREEVEALLDRNRARFLDRHRENLFAQGPQPRAGASLDHDPWRLRVLYVDDRVPHLDLGAGLPRANAILNAMAELSFAVTFFPNYGADAEEAQRYRDLDERIEICHATGDEGFARLIQERRDHYDVLWVSRPHNILFVLQALDALGLDPRGFVRSRVIFDSEALFSLRDFVTEAATGGSAVAADLAWQAEREARRFGLADAVVCVSHAEARVLARYAACTVAVLGHALALPEAPSPDFSDRAGFVFVGALGREGQPNVDSLDWFFGHVWLRVRAALPEATLTIVGEIADTIRDRFGREGVRITGRVPRTEPHLDAARVFLAPTRFAAGIPHKVHEAVAHGLPCLATPILSEQLGWPDGTGLLARDWRDPEAFAAALIRLHEDAGLWRSVRQNGLDRIRAECDPQAFRNAIRSLCEAQTVA
ncbi:glycosyltransferase [Methylorubrum salsuginis]|uniref:Glycosyltransferase, GT2 family n=1 Tax=Methylorubrum salsuginis TaxID=414703 RepID=A0A1I4BPV0_9HYPH|nr:glycosyltransferase [Methylorubrum salsuginis]SFK70197.1 Glycosyltransferase, GT2 family [Methylorubrum salsuginis]